MQDQRAPKVVVNEDFLDLREDPQKFLASSNRGYNSTNNPQNASTYLQTNGLRYEKEILNVRFLGHEGSVLKSQSDISFCNSPKKSRDNGSNVRRNSSVVHLYQKETKTMKPVNKNINKNESKGSKTSKKDDNRRQHQRAKSKDYNEYHATNYVDPKLSESYCPNKTIEWKRSWTLPVFSPKSQPTQKQTPGDNFDRTTYLYDDGTDIDSSFLQTDRNKIMDQEPCTSMQFMVLLFIVGSLCGFLLVSLCIWLLFGNELVDILLKPRPKEYRITKYFNYLGKQILHIITTIFEKLGKVLVLPAQQVYQPTNNIWTRNQL
nr:unnamed protein product [Callosobruchus analis]